jgi:hypothetical protein
MLPFGCCGKGVHHPGISHKGSSVGREGPYDGRRQTSGKHTPSFFLVALFEAIQSVFVSMGLRLDPCFDNIYQKERNVHIRARGWLSS